MRSSDAGRSLEGDWRTRGACRAAGRARRQPWQPSWWDRRVNSLGSSGPHPQVQRRGCARHAASAPILRDARRRWCARVVRTGSLFKTGELQSRDGQNVERNPNRVPFCSHARGNERSLLDERATTGRTTSLVLGLLETNALAADLQQITRGVEAPGSSPPLARCLQSPLSMRRPRFMVARADDPAASTAPRMRSRFRLP